MVAVSVAALAGVVAAQETDERFIQEPGAERLISVSGPGEKDDAKYFPNGAPVSGQVLIRCAVTDKGTVTDCGLVREDPPGSGLAAVAMQEVNLFRFKPKGRDGKPVTGQKVILRQFYLAPGDKDPGWLRKPTADNLASVLPVRALREGKDGSATIRCEVTPEGFLDRCSVLSEAPEGYGFGSSALLLKTQFAMTPKIRGGKPVRGVVTIPIHWTGLEGRGEPVSGARLALDPNWTVVPSAAAIKAAYPAEAADVASGQAAVRCKLTAKGQASNCSLTSEIPPGKGFGKAAKSLTSNFVIQFSEADAKALKAIQVDIPFRFRNPAAPDNGVLTDVRWIRTLSPAGADLLFPAAARAEGVLTGVGAVNCAATARGDLTDCTVQREDPPGKGFGAAALEAAKLMQMNPWTKTGDAVEGRRLTLPIRFRLESTKPAPAATPAPLN